jgi:hypothetical protein
MSSVIACLQRRSSATSVDRFAGPTPRRLHLLSADRPSLSVAASLQKPTSGNFEATALFPVRSKHTSGALLGPTEDLPVDLTMGLDRRASGRSNAKIMQHIGKSSAELLEALDRPTLKALP